MKHLLNVGGLFHQPLLEEIDALNEALKFYNSNVDNKFIYAGINTQFKLPHLDPINDADEICGKIFNLKLEEVGLNVWQLCAEAVPYGNRKDHLEVAITFDDVEVLNFVSLCKMTPYGSTLPQGIGNIYLTDNDKEYTQKLLFDYSKLVDGSRGQLVITRVGEEIHIDNEKELTTLTAAVDTFNKDISTPKSDIDNRAFILLDTPDEDHRSNAGIIKNTDNICGEIMKLYLLDNKEEKFKYQMYAAMTPHGNKKDDLAAIIKNRETDICVVDKPLYDKNGHINFIKQFYLVPTYASF